MTASITLAKGREKSLLRRHPWVFSGAVSKVKGKPQLGDTVNIYATDGSWVARGAYSAESQIRARIWTFDESEEVDEAFFLRRIAAANARKLKVLADNLPTAYRVVAAESDGLPGITIDKYADTVVCQLLSAGGERWRGAIVAALQHVFPQHSVYERSDVDVRKKEGLLPVTNLLHGEMPSTEAVIEENGLKLLVDIQQGHKTGYYLDQRDNRLVSADYAKDKTVLNCFSYTGGFGTYALKAGAAHVVNVDMSQPALDIAKQNVELNGLDLSKAEFIREDVFKLLRRYRAEGKQFDTIILDPPKFVDSKQQLTRACRGYKDINMIAMQLLKPGGILLTFSCSGLMPTDLFQKVVADAALDAGREAWFLKWLHQSQDHPVLSSYPEGLYLKGLVVQVD
ncbi:methyltransferase domain-containing protein [Corallincola holothuriorum]|uniref:Ribosomal RNA large subunit methyltransferase I n=1 Tax=Corallincola holothuriorum TaxID=2282215 RepID=A0A368NQ70_9GAMM|nr:class I SAM-dependent methyltransferase [Corallincola holothuriorum]RCU52717.1 methyltransferase domain-containing protein [Corallincola holothuriorum]